MDSGRLRSRLAYVIARHSDATAHRITNTSPSAPRTTSTIRPACPTSHPLSLPTRPDTINTDLPCKPFRQPFEHLRLVVGTRPFDDRGGLPMFGRKSQSYAYPDDIFDSTRMSFGDHIEELRARMILAIYGLLVCLVIGFILDAIGSAIGNKNIGIGKPMIEIITDPVETQVRDFYYRRVIAQQEAKLNGLQGTEEAEIERIRKKLKDGGDSLDVLTSEERQKLLGAPQEMPVEIDAEAFVPAFGPL